METPPDEGQDAAVADDAETNPALPTSPTTRHPTSADVISDEPTTRRS
jgi:hypothetical protein